MRARAFRWCTAAVAAAVLFAACSTPDDDDSADATSPTSGTETSSSTGELTASARGVTADSIKIGFSYIDLETLAEQGVIKISHGPYEEIIKTLVDDVNANGGINGRQLELVTAKYSPIGNEEQLAACTKVTEDDQVFAVLNGLLNENNMCIVEQHETILVSGIGITGERLQRARAPWATSFASSERSIKALIGALDENGDLDGKTIGVYAAQAANQPLIDLAVQELEAAGYEAADTALLDVPENDTQAATAQNTVIAQRMKDKGVDTLINVGLLVPGADFDAADFHPAIYVLDAGNIAAAAFTNPLGKFPIVAGLSATETADDIYDNAEFTRCRDVYEKANGTQIKTPEQEDLDGQSSGYTAMTIACTDLQIFVAAATAAGPDLTNESFAKGLASIGDIELANAPDSSFGPDKPDGQDSFVIQKFDPNWKEGEGKPQFTAVGAPFTLDE